MKCFLLFLALAVESQAFNCYVGDDAATAASTACNTDSSAVTQNSCVGPTFTDYTGFQDPAVKYQCGSNANTGVCVVASDNSAATGCKECTDTDDCNKPVETTTFKCLAYTYTDSWAASATQDCIILESEAKAKTFCNKPKANDTAQGDYTNTGAAQCGKCTDTSDTNCVNYVPKMYDCKTWAYNTTAKMWKAGADKSCGPIESTEEGKCNEPADTSGAATGGYDNSDVCGACATDAKNCKTSGAAMTTLSVLLLTLTALLHFY